ncbi:hypothetical protein QFC21_004030 [Naganishia friedmannii]|uniref:Uncharacterized protein n=1 Tax=Naganishia friedmannii TaxID=89922 RepID=A0ACC2VK38_9TREE|nr:hypothetical protein QFC21_004030 [Naganishia friedmannii]
MFPDHSLLVPLDYTHVLYDPSTHPVGPVLALLTLSPFFLFSAYTAVIVINRPLSVVNLLVGQLGNEVWNGVLKKSLKGERPWVVGDGWGMPSSHSQRQHTTGAQLPIRSTTTQKVTRWVLVTGLGVWSGLTAYSRVYLHYHTFPQVA